MPEDALSTVRRAMMTGSDLSGQFVSKYKCTKGDIMSPSRFL